MLAAHWKLSNLFGLAKSSMQGLENKEVTRPEDRVSHGLRFAYN